MADGFAVEMQDVVKKFITPEGGILAAVNHVTMQIKDGEFFSLLGASGCGKTTSLRMIAGFELPTEGKILIHGKDMSQVPAFKRPVNTVFQQYALFPHMTVEQNIGFGLEMKGVDKAERSGHRDLLRRFGLSADRYVQRTRHLRAQAHGQRWGTVRLRRSDHHLHRGVRAVRWRWRGRDV